MTISLHITSTSQWQGAMLDRDVGICSAAGSMVRRQASDLTWPVRLSPVAETSVSFSVNHQWLGQARQSYSQRACRFMLCAVTHHPDAG